MAGATLDDVSTALGVAAIVESLCSALFAEWGISEIPDTDTFYSDKQTKVVMVALTLQGQPTVIKG